MSKSFNNTLKYIEHLLALSEQLSEIDLLIKHYLGFKHPM